MYFYFKQLSFNSHFISFSFLNYSIGKFIINIISWVVFDGWSAFWLTGPQLWLLLTGFSHSSSKHSNMAPKWQFQQQHITNKILTFMAENKITQNKLGQVSQEPVWWLGGGVRDAEGRSSNTHHFLSLVHPNLETWSN